MTPRLNLQDALAAFRTAFTYDHPEGLTITPQVEGGTLRVEVRHQDVNALRGFDVVAEPLESEERNAAQLGEDVARVVEQELMYGQLPAADEDGAFRRIVV
ncbi:hypothetical protein DEIPH_ctg025orf0194 [Deinococcus phoenicis]|uniref:Uncharacterized protein n=1 Tax=Deinococcus phoenicis TaxID=1476583 RepID=A0A016QQP4_9DEIO|nr:hypothetical protein [Deinococcus phoenicis]EYB68321.1 hypothetical protein DEIPH_ctg025orf0194 [Deinococcus phoenicis]